MYTYAWIVKIHHPSHLSLSTYIMKTGSSQPCLDVRKKLSACYQQNPRNSSFCDAFVDELSMCIDMGVERKNKEAQFVH